MAGRKLHIWPVGGRGVGALFQGDKLTDGENEEELGVVCTDGFEQIAPCTVSPRYAG